MTVEIRKGQTLTVVITDTVNTPIGDGVSESRHLFTYEELLARLGKKAKGKKVRKAATAGVRFSRALNLAYHAVNTGKWSTGAKISEDKVIDGLMKKFYQLLDTGEFLDLTHNGVACLKDLKGMVTPENETKLNTIHR